MMAVLKQAADMFMPCVESLYQNPVHGSILQQEIQELCKSYDVCNNDEDFMTCFINKVTQELATMEEFTLDAEDVSRRTVGCILASKTLPREKSKLFATFHWLLLLLK
ncbi:unnamed protein product [Ixodes pacificus]